MTATKSKKPNEVDERAARFVSELGRLDRGDLAGLRRTLGGDERGAYWLEGLYVRSGYGQEDANRKTMLGLVAGLYALKPPIREDGEGGAPEQNATATGQTPAPEQETTGKTTASKTAPSMGLLMGRLYMAQDKRPSTEKRFLALLDADRDGLAHHLRQAVTLLATQNLTPDWAQLVSDLLYWGDRKRRKWAQDFYGEIYRDAKKTPAGESAASASTDQSSTNLSNSNDIP